MQSVYSAVRTGSLNKAACLSSLKGYMKFGRLLRFILKLAQNNTLHYMLLTPKPKESGFQIDVPSFLQVTYLCIQMYVICRLVWNNIL